MSVTKQLIEIVEAIKTGEVVPYLGPGVLNGVTNTETGEAIPASSDELILAMNNGQPMAPRLMYEFPRAAMNQELKKGRSFVERFLNTTYQEKTWSEAPVHKWLKTLDTQYIVDINRDTQLQNFYSTIPHILIHGCARVAGTDYRFRIYQYDGSQYSSVSQDDIDFSKNSLPILFKPMGSPLPEPSYIAADADYVDYITELMGGFAIPNFLKEYRKDKKYLLLGMKLTRDTERMVFSEIIYAASSPSGWALIPDATEKEIRFCQGKGIEVLNCDYDALMEAVGESSMEVA